MKKEDFIKKLDKERNKLAEKLLRQASTEELISLWNDFCEKNLCKEYMIYDYNIDFINKTSLSNYKESDFVFDYDYAWYSYRKGLKTFDNLNDLDSPFDFTALEQWLTDNYRYYYNPDPEDYY